MIQSINNRAPADIPAASKLLHAFNAFNLPEMTLWETANKQKQYRDL